MFGRLDKTVKTSMSKKKRYTLRVLAVFVVLAIFLVPESPVGPSSARANGTPEIPPALLPVFVIGVTGLFLKIRRKYNVK